MKINFIPIQAKDYYKVINMFQSAAERINQMAIDHWQYWKNPPLEKIQWVKDGLLNNEYFFVVNTKEETVGMVRILNQDLIYWGKQNEKANYIHSLVVKEQYSGKGLGIQILNQVAKNAKQQQCKYLRLDADAKNPKLCCYYEKQGFKKVGEKQMTLSTYNLYQKEL